MYASKTRKEKFSGPGENCQRNVTDLAGSLVASSRPPGRLQKRPDDRTSNAGVAARTADGSRRTADAGDEQCLRCGCSSASCTVVLCAADIRLSGPTFCVITATNKQVPTVVVAIRHIAAAAQIGASYSPGGASGQLFTPISIHGYLHSCKSAPQTASHSSHLVQPLFYGSRLCPAPVTDPGVVQGAHTPALLFRCPFLKRTYFENMLRFLAEQGAS